MPETWLNCRRCDMVAQPTPMEKHLREHKEPALIVWGGQLEQDGVGGAEVRALAGLAVEMRECRLWGTELPWTDIAWIAAGGSFAHVRKIEVVKIELPRIYAVALNSEDTLETVAIIRVGRK